MNKSLHRCLQFSVNAYLFERLLMLNTFDSISTANFLATSYASCVAILVSSSVRECSFNSNSYNPQTMYSKNFSRTSILFLSGPLRFAVGLNFLQRVTRDWILSFCVAVRLLNSSCALTSFFKGIYLLDPPFCCCPGRVFSCC